MSIEKTVIQSDKFLSFFLFRAHTKHLAFKHFIKAGGTLMTIQKPLLSPQEMIQLGQ